MYIKVFYLGLIRDRVGKKEEFRQLKEGSTLSFLLNDLASTYGDRLGEIFLDEKTAHFDPTFIATVNGVIKNHYKGEEVILNSGDTVTLMTLISGG